MTIRWSRVDIARRVPVTTEPGSFDIVETIVDSGYIRMMPAGANTLYKARVMEQEVTHEGWVRNNHIWKEVKINDVLLRSVRRLVIVTISEAGEMEGDFLHVTMYERNIKEEHSA